MAIFEGAGVALVTPFREDGEVNYEKLEEILEEQIAGGTDAIIACGTTGECDLLVLDEILGIVDCGIITVEELIRTIKAKEKEMSVVLTGKVFPEGLEPYVDSISVIENVKSKSSSVTS